MVGCETEMTSVRQEEVMPTARPAKPSRGVRSRNIAWRTTAIAVGFGAVTGIIAALTLRVMHWL